MNAMGEVYRIFGVTAAIRRGRILLEIHIVVFPRFIIQRHVCRSSCRDYLHYFTKKYPLSSYLIKDIFSRYFKPFLLYLIYVINDEIDSIVFTHQTTIDKYIIAFQCTPFF